MAQLSMFGSLTGTMRVETTNSKNYLPDWNTISAVKELLQNAVYAKTVLGARIKLEHDGRLARISDNAHGFSMDKLLIGNSEQRNSDYSPGFFGEGMKMAILVSSRNCVECRFETVGFSVVGAIEEGVLGPDTLVLYISPNKRKRGTEFSIECSKEEFEEACKSFAILNGVQQSNVMAATLLPSSPNKVYVAGVLVTEPTSMWGYNLMDKALINRDRTAVDHDLLVRNVRAVLMGITKPALAEQLLRAIGEENHREFLEETACLSYRSFEYTDKQRKMWKAVGRKVFGKACIATGEDSDTDARYRGFNVITGLNYDWRQFFDNMLNIPYSRDIVRVAKKPKRKAVKLTQEERKLLNRYKRVIKDFYSDCGTVKVAENLQNEFGNSVMGLHDRNTGLIWLDRVVLLSEEDLFTTLLHETNHKQSGAKDNSVEFTEQWEYICWRLFNSKQRRRVAKPAKVPLVAAA
jgi:DNA mismatch repair enzyme (predicted ATPase)